MPCQQLPATLSCGSLSLSGLNQSTRGDNVLSGADLDGAVAAGSADDFRADQPVRPSGLAFTRPTAVNPVGT